MVVGDRGGASLLRAVVYPNPSFTVSEQLLLQHVP